MELKNGYKVLFEVIDTEAGTRTFKATKTDIASAEEIVSVAIGTFKLVYEKNGAIYGSVTGIPAEGDEKINLDKVLVEATVEDDQQ